MAMQVIFEEMTQPSPRGILLASLTFLFAMHLWRRIRRTLDVHGPPGPFAWPVIGNAVELGKSPHLYFTRMSRKYGDVFQIKLGCRDVVVLNGDAIKQALIKKGFDFAGRPDFASFKYISNGDSMAFGTFSECWKMHRKVAQSTVRMFSTSNNNTKKSFENHVVCEVRELLHIFLKKTKEHQYFQPNTYLVVSTANIMTAVCFGKRYSYDDAEFAQVVGRNDQFTQTVGAGSMVDVMPWLQYFPNPIKTIFENFKDLNREFSKFIINKVVEHRKTIHSSTIRDMTDAFIMALDKQDSSSRISPGKDYVPPTIGDIFGASQDTLSTALQWIILILVRFPHIQLRLQEEVDKVVDRRRLPTIEDQPQLPYVMAFIYEVMRFTSFLPLTIPHSTIVDTDIMGYTIPKDTVIFINQWSSNHDSTKWTQPETFDPLRFLDHSGSLNKDRASSVLIFSLGKRRCIGEELSKMQMFLFTSLLVHQVHFSPDPDNPLSIDYTYGLTLKPNNFYIAVNLRDSIEVLEESQGNLGISQSDRE
ncbi:cytochrome P450 1B1 [Esox lucius]|uniref:Cytochrome P450 1A n=1 Tax=Esox lucius TaxID=8010 RepID=A0A3P8YUV3_ESOLU|nr:cytochrome P450 1B1 [Esox lucius]XP_010901518.1 cytochrome P450 1B1 [Esox lucius]